MNESPVQPVRVEARPVGKVEQAKAKVKELTQKGREWFKDKWDKVTAKPREVLNDINISVPTKKEDLYLVDSSEKTNTFPKTPDDSKVEKISVAETTRVVAEPIEEKTINLDDLDHIGSIPVFVSGNEKSYRKFIEPDGKVKVIAEYKKPVSADFLKAATAQQRILHTLFPERFILDIYDQQVGSDGLGRFVTDFAEIDTSKSINVTESGSDAMIRINYTADIRNSPGFGVLIPELKKIGFIPEHESLEGDRMEINELAGNTVFDKKGNQIIVDLTTPYIADFSDDRKTVRPRLDIEKVIELAKQKGVYENIKEAIVEYRASGENTAHEQQKYLDDTPVWKT